MPNPQFTKPWHGVPREQILWNPAIIEAVCIGCGTCVTGCSRLVYRFDFERKKPVVIDPLNCMVGCTTCANTCPSHAITFPPIETILALEGKAAVRHAVEDDLIARRDILATTVSVPHPDRIVALSVSRIEHPTSDVMEVTLMPVVPGECFCEFVPGQYIEIWQPDSTHLSRSYSIANAPHADGSINLHIRNVDEGRFTTWAFKAMKVGDRLLARGPLGSFTMRSPADVSLLFVAGGTGLAPVLALLEQQVDFSPQRNMVLIWGVKHLADFYLLDHLLFLLAHAPNLRIYLTAISLQGAHHSHERLTYIHGTVLDALPQDTTLIDDRDVYVAGPSAMLRDVSHALSVRRVPADRVHIDSYGA
jgi:CDP-4-dehydro-6-deoxyglucose reductase